MESTGGELIPDESKNVLTIDDMPFELLLKTFGYLTRKELIAAQCVCCSWRTVAHDKSLWKNYTFVISGTPEDERRLTVMPALQNIDGHVDNNFINIILDHITNLNKMNCKFKPPMSLMQMQSLVQKYPKLQSITLDVCSADILESVKVLQTSEKITELIFHKEITCISSSDFECACSSLSELTNIMNIIADPRNFLFLSNVDIIGLTCAGAFKYPLFVSVFTRVLTNRSHQLQSLQLDITSAVDVDVINALHMCSRLHNLNLQFYNKCPAIIDISKMPQLRSLTVHMLINDDDVFIALYDSFRQNTWLYLTEVRLHTYTTSKYKSDILGLLTKNARQLKSLRYCILDGIIKECHLEHIGNLSKLEILSLPSFQNISKKGITYISHCYNLKYLHLTAERTNIKNLKPCIANMIRSLKQLEHLSFIAGTSYICLNSKEEIKSFASRHGNNT